MEWYEEFRAYARAFGSDEVAAVLLRDGEREWIAWPAQTVEGLTFTMSADAILSAVSAEDLQHVVGWVHSHPMGMSPDPSGTDDIQIREMARDMGGNVAEMWIFGGHDYRTISITQAVLVGSMVFVADMEMLRIPVEATPHDDAATAFYKASRPVAPAPSLVPARYDMFPKWDDDDIEKEAMGSDFCTYCLRHTADAPGMLCNDCDDMMLGHAGGIDWAVD